MEKWRVEEAIRDTFKIEQLIEQRRCELEVPWRESDDNIGGGKSSKTHPSEEMLPIKLADDPLLNMYEHYKKIIVPLYNALTGIEMKVIYLYYTQPRERRASWKCVQEQIKMPTSVCRKICNDFVDKVSVKL